jgi:hypothetical protein
MKDPQTRRNFIKSVEELTEIAEACGEMEACALLYLLGGALMVGDEPSLLKATHDYNLQIIGKIDAKISQG